MRITEDNDARLVVRARPWLAWCLAWPAIAAACAFVVGPSPFSDRRAGWMLLAFGLAALACCDFDLRVEADKATRFLTIDTRWLWRRRRVRARFRDVVSIEESKHESSGSLDWRADASGIVIRFGHRQTIRLRNASLDSNHDAVIGAVRAAVQ
jgi:hypothetical protein